MYPIDLLSEDELHDIYNYYQLSVSYPHDEYLLPIEDLLGDWNKNKTTLCKALGGKLRVEIPVDVSLFNDSTDVIAQDLSTIYNFYPIDTWEAKIYMNMDEDSLQNVFQDIFVARFFYNVFPFIKEEDVFDLTCLFSYKQIAEQRVQKTYEFTVNGKKVKIPEGCKPIKGIRKIIMCLDEKIQKNILPLFTRWCDAISNIRTRSTRPRSIVISIHPLDILMASDNHCGWTSCLDFRRPGAYRAGILEYLGSKNCLIVYAKHSKDMQVSGMRQPLPNKFWRAFAFVNKHIAIIGKSYPFHSKSIDCAALSGIEDLVKENLKWNYQYKQEEYKDSLYWDWSPTTNERAHRIFFVSHGLVYNDFPNNPSYPFVCSRNYVPKTIDISIGATAHCVVCGEPLIEDDCGEACEIVCYNCLNKELCECCESHYDPDEVYLIPVYNVITGGITYTKMCESCAQEELRYDIEEGHFIAKNLCESDKEYLDFYTALLEGHI